MVLDHLKANFFWQNAATIWTSKLNWKHQWDFPRGLVVPDNPNTNISGNSYLFCRLAEAEALLVGDDSNIGFGSTCSAAIDKVSTDFGDASAFALQVSYVSFKLKNGPAITYDFFEFIK